MHGGFPYKNEHSKESLQGRNELMQYCSSSSSLVELFVIDCKKERAGTILTDE